MKQDLDDLLTDDEEVSGGLNQTISKSKKNAEETAEHFLMQIPPDFERAEIHGKANVVYDIDKVRINPADPNSFCKCCGNPVVTDDTLYSICCDI